MPPTKRKRRTKHRGTAAGTIESRGRTGRKPTAAERKRDQARERRTTRLDRPPSWRSAAAKAGFAAVLLFLLTQLGIFGERVALAQGLVLSAFAWLLYLPLSYATDRWIYNRRRKLKQRRS